MGTVCPYCNIEVSESAIEAEDGCCPECGSIISVSSAFVDPEENPGAVYEEGGEFDVDDEDDFLESEDFDEDFLDKDFSDKDLDFEDEDFEDDDEED